MADDQKKDGAKANEAPKSSPPPAPGTPGQSVPKDGPSSPSAGPDPAKAQVGGAVPGDAAKATVPVSAPGGPNSPTDANTQTYAAIKTEDVNTGPQPNAVREDAAAANRTPSEVEKARAAQGVVINGRQGMPFSITGSGFGHEEGTLTVGGRSVHTTRWNDTSIKGQLPEDLQSGDVVVRTRDGREQRGQFTRR